MRSHIMKRLSQVRMPPGQLWSQARNSRKIGERERNGEQTKDHEIEAERNYLSRNVKVGEIPARSMLVLDNDISKALEKMSRINELRAKLPQRDCGVCGAPSCDALAHDIVMGEASLSDCIFMK